jgi:dimethylhistidine N-methyltransferase
MFAAGAASIRPFDPELARAVTDGLARSGQKTLPPAWFYDEVGSALFEVITVLPEYGLTRSEAALLSDAAAEIVNLAAQPSLIIELGSGTGTKTRHILEAATVNRRVRYLPIDISGAALHSCEKILGNIRDVTVQPVESTYLDGIDTALALRRGAESALILFLGSTLGNFTRAEAGSFLTRVRSHMRAGDYLLLGTDLVKTRARLLTAYDDPIGVTAAFNLNVLARINRELDADFDLSRFAHEARWNDRESRIEMHLRSRVAQTVRIAALGLNIGFAQHETIWTESSHKFRAEEIAPLGRGSGFGCVRQWLEPSWGFAETLFRTAQI